MASENTLQQKINENSTPRNYVSVHMYSTIIFTISRCSINSVNWCQSCKFPKFLKVYSSQRELGHTQKYLILFIMNILNICPILKREQFLTVETRVNYTLLRYPQVALIATYVHLIQLFQFIMQYSETLRKWATLEIFQKTRLKYNSEV